MEPSPKLLFYINQDQKKQKEQEKQLKIPRKEEQLSRQNKKQMVEEMSRLSNFCHYKIEKNPWKTTKSCRDNLTFCRDIYQKGNVKQIKLSRQPNDNFEDTNLGECRDKFIYVATKFPEINSLISRGNCLDKF